MTAYVYRHIRHDKNEPFYIGVGGLDKFDNYGRAHDKNGRNNYWRNIVNITTYDVEILLDDLTREEALLKETEFVKLYGRRNNKTGILSNLTDGGIGGVARVVPDSVKLYLKELYSGKPRPEHVKKAMNRLGWNHSEESKIKIGNASKGDKNPFYGKKQLKWVVDKHSKPVLNLETGIFYDSVKEASKTTHFKYDNFKHMLGGILKNKTNFIQI